MIATFREMLLGKERFCTNFLFNSVQYTSGTVISPWLVSTIFTELAPAISHPSFSMRPRVSHLKILEIRKDAFFHDLSLLLEAVETARILTVQDGLGPDERRKGF